MKRLLAFAIWALVPTVATGENRILLQYPGDGSGLQHQGGGVQHLAALFRVFPSMILRPRNAPPIYSSVDLEVAVVDQFGQIVPNSDITITYSPVDNSGWHVHTEPGRPKGTYAPESGNTGPDGWLPVKYTAPEVSGLIFSHFACATPNGGPCTPLSGEVEVSVDLDSLSCGDTIGTNNRHPTNNYGLVSLERNCQAAREEYLALYPDAPFKTNDISLPWGGLFDHSDAAPWSNPHWLHRWGNNMDMRFMDQLPPRRRILREVLERHNFEVEIHQPGPHLHLTTTN